MPNETTRITKEELQEKIRQVCLGYLSDSKFDEIPIMEELEKEDKERYNEALRLANLIINSDLWKILLKSVIQPQKDAATMKADNYDIVTFHRATINGVMLTDKFLNDFAKKFNALSQGEKEKLDDDDPTRFQSFQSELDLEDR